MENNKKFKTISVIVAAIAVIVIAVLTFVQRERTMRAEIRLLQENQRALLETCQHYATQDSLNAVTVGNIELCLSDLRESNYTLVNFYQDIQTDLEDLESATILLKDMSIGSVASVRDTYYLLDGYDVPVRFYERPNNTMNELTYLDTLELRSEPNITDPQTRLAYDEYVREQRE